MFGGRATPTTEIYLLPQSSAFTKVQAVAVHVTGKGGTIQTPARLLSGVGASLHGMSADAVQAFHRDALPELGALTEIRTKITVGTFYDMTVVVQSPTSLSFVFTPVGVAPQPNTSRWASNRRTTKRAVVRLTLSTRTAALPLLAG